MYLRTAVIGVFALVFGGSAAAGVYLVSSKSPQNPDSEMSSIVILTADVPRGASLTAAMIDLRPWPKAFVPQGAITDLEDALERGVSIPLVKDEPLLEVKLTPKGAGRGLASLIPNGMRAVTIQTPNISTGVAGFVLPGNKVDVLVTLSHVGQDDGSGGSGTTTLLQNVEILAVDQRIEAPSENMVDLKELRSVTLLVTPAEAARLDLGQNKGTLSLALRNPEDTAMSEIEPATLTGLRFRHSNAPAFPHSETTVKESSPDREPTSAGGTVLPPIRTLRGSVHGAVHLHPVGMPAERG